MKLLKHSAIDSKEGIHIKVIFNYKGEEREYNKLISKNRMDEIIRNES
jgi:hypothetical protein